MVDLYIHRKQRTDKQTLGIMEVYKDGVFKFKLATLELPWKNNEIGKSCIPFGKYTVCHFNSPTHPNTFMVKGTHPRTGILLHSGNRYTHTLGCILLGLVHRDIDMDGYLDVINSKDAMDKLNQICENERIINLSIS